jgi:hypothetical protein
LTNFGSSGNFGKFALVLGFRSPKIMKRADNSPQSIEYRLAKLTLKWFATRKERRWLKRQMRLDGQSDPALYLLRRVRDEREFLE